MLCCDQGRPIGEPVVQHGPFVMNSKAEIMEAFVSTSIAAQAQALQQQQAVRTIWEQLTSTKWSCAQADYQRTEFEGPAGWPFETDGADDHAKVWPREKGRFALYSDGREELPAEECAAAAAAAGGR